MNDYNRKAVGERIRMQRKALGISQEEFAERIGRVPKFCADIERGQAGMSIQTMLVICSLLKMTPNEVILGKADEENCEEVTRLMDALKQCTKQQRKDAYELVKLFLRAVK